MSWRFAITPKWIVRHIAVVLLITAMILLLLWQVSRLHQKQRYKRLVEGREAATVVAVESIVPPGATEQSVTDVMYRTVDAVGTYEADRTVVVENRTDDNDNPGGWVLTPLDLGGGRTLLINRGFIGLDPNGRVTAPPAPTGRVDVSGLLFPSQHRGHFGGKDPATGVLTVVARVDLARIGQQVHGELMPAYLQLTKSVPGERPVPITQAKLVPLGPPILTEGPHFSYAVQWGIFSTIAAVGYVLLLRKVAREQAQAQAIAAEDAAEDADETEGSEPEPV